MCIDNVFIISQVFLHTQKLFVSGWRDSFGSEYLLLFLKPILEFPAPISCSQLPITLTTRNLNALLASRDIVLRFSYHTLAYSKLNMVQNKKNCLSSWTKDTQQLELGSLSTGSSMDMHNYKIQSRLPIYQTSLAVR